ncbi:hypothetical protein CFter6_4858 [Collimonas fungivorans]|uniref:Uncharacterized protein n=1 Tax=Collimonas fungivorans TaxID=158899 RepID=A0A127PI73_9BURK|nr:hypothetical protein CFter6_4858 [Collimonas fungivorans]
MYRSRRQSCSFSSAKKRSGMACGLGRHFTAAGAGASRNADGLRLAGAAAAGYPQ